jgi:transcriptional regulator with XRE-family HTH domain
MKTIFDPRYCALIDLLKTRRCELGLSQEQVTRQLQVTRSWIGKVEQRERRLDVLETWLLCRLYGISLKDIEKTMTSAVKRP